MSMIVPVMWFLDASVLLIFQVWGVLGVQYDNTSVGPGDAVVLNGARVSIIVGKEG